MALFVFNLIMMTEMIEVAIIYTNKLTYFSLAGANVALNKTATQFSDLDYIFFWTADKAVDGCSLRDDPDNQECCSATQGGMENFWTVDLEQQYLVNRIAITARPAGRYVCILKTCNHRLYAINSCKIILD